MQTEPKVLRLEFTLDLGEHPDVAERLDRARKRFGLSRSSYLRRVLMMALETDLQEKGTER